MKVAIRDDDTSFYTNVEDLEKAFSDLNGIPISLAVVPYAVADHAGVHPYGEVENTEEYADISNNMKLVSYIKDGIHNQRFEVIQHGVTHELKRVESGKLRAETDFTEKNLLLQGIVHGREHMQNVFETKISTFAAPCNAVSPGCSWALNKIGMNVSFDTRWRMIRNLSIHYLFNFGKSNFFRLFTGVKYGGVLHYSHHKEMDIHEFLGVEESWMRYLECKKFGFPMVIYTHYWELNSNPSKRKELVTFFEKAVEDGAEPVFVSECYETSNNIFQA